MDGAQLLLNHAPIGVLVLLYMVPWANSFPVWGEVQMSTFALLLLVGISLYGGLDGVC